MAGAPIATVELDAPAEEDAASLLALTDLKPGYLLQALEVRAAIERLYALGRFAQVEAYVLPLGDCAALRITLSPILRLGAIEVRGIKHIREAGLLQSLHLGSGDELDSQSDSLIVERALKYAGEAGLPLAAVRLQSKPGKQPSTVDYTLYVEEGPTNDIVSVTLAGALPVRAAVLGEGLYARQGAIADAERLEQDRQLLRRRLREHGFLRGQVRLLPLAQQAAGAAVTFLLQGHERLQFSFAGNLLFDDYSLREAWPQHLDGAPASLLPLYRQRLLALYAKQGYPHAKVRLRLVTPGQRGRAPGATSPSAPAPAQAKSCRLLVAVDEGPPTAVGRIVLSGNTAFPPQVWQQQVRSRLAAEAADDSFFAPLGPAYRAHEEGRLYGMSPTAHRLPAEQRWVADIYQEAANDVGAALGELGFLHAEIAAPKLVQLPAPTVPPASRGFFGGDEDPLVQAQSAMGTTLPPAIERWQAEVVASDGPQAFIERLTIGGNVALSAAEVRAYIMGTDRDLALSAPLSAGSPYSAAGLEDARIGLIKVLRNKGYLYAAIDADVSASAAEPQAVAIALHFRTGPKVHIDHLLIRGNRYTRVGVIRSRLRLRPGQPYRLEQALDDQQQVLALGTFSRVSVRLVEEDHQNEHKDVVVEVEERPRQLIEVVPGLSSTQGPRLLASYTHLNVFGTASTFVAALKVNRQLFFNFYGNYAEGLRARYKAYRGVAQLTRALEREVRLGLRAPPLRALWFDPLFRLDIVDQRINAVRYGLDATTITLGADIKLLRRLLGAVEIQGGIASLECPLGNNCEDARNELRRLRGGRIIQQGRYNTLKFGPWLRFEGRNDVISPSRGLLAYGRVTQVFGEAYRQATDATFRFIKYEGQLSTYVPLGKPVLALTLRAGTMQIQRSTIPVDERFLLGGRDSLRGFVEGTLMPDDACVIYSEDQVPPPHCVGPIVTSPGVPAVSLGGNTYALLKTELRLPVRGGLSFDLFADIGNLWLDLWHVAKFRLRYGTGVGLRYATPVGAMTLDFGVNPARRAANSEVPWQIHFSIGSF